MGRHLGESKDNVGVWARGSGGGGGGGGGGGFSLGLGEGNCDLWVLIRGGGAPWTREWFSAMHADSCSI